MNEAIRAEAAAILAAAAKRVPVTLERLQVFALACLRQNRIAWLANAVMRGGDHAPRRALELAETVLTAIPEAAPGRRLPPPGFYFCPVCELDLPLTEPCAHIAYGEGLRPMLIEIVRRGLAATGHPRCEAHEAPLANEAFFTCGCRYFAPPPEAG